MTIIDMDKYNSLVSIAADIQNQISEKQKELALLQNNLSATENGIKSLLSKGYWYTYDIDKDWHKPKKYSIKKVSCDGKNTYITVKEVFKKKPWPGFTGERVYYMDEFLKLSIHKTAEEATEAHKMRICPKCGGYMGLVTTKWCRNCMDERRRVKKEFDDSHTFYEPNEGHHYRVEYVDELTKDLGYMGKQFIIRRKDTGEIIHTRNLWAMGYGQNLQNAPEIEFLEWEP